ncbi:MAG TPA: hypothetical protein VGP72_14270 [Planctomycetota bacterium]|jgi:hypothetical protein
MLSCLTKIALCALALSAVVLADDDTCPCSVRRERRPRVVREERRSRDPNVSPSRNYGLAAPNPSMPGFGAPPTPSSTAYGGEDDHPWREPQTTAGRAFHLTAPLLLGGF